MTALSLELMNITRDWVSSFVMLCQAFTAADFSCRIFHFFTFKNSRVAFAVCFGSFDWICAESISLYTSEFFWLLLSSVTSINTSNPEPLEAMHAHAITLIHHVSQMMFYALDHELFQDFSILFFFPSFWYRLVLISAIHRMLFQKWSGFVRCFLAV